MKYERVGFFRRLFTSGIDLLIFCLSINIYSQMFPGVINYSSPGLVKLFVLWYVCIFFIPMLISDQFQTFGMYIMNIRLFREECHIRPAYFIIRYNILSVLLMATFPLLLFSKKRKTLYDYLSSAQWQRMIPQTTDLINE